MRNHGSLPTPAAWLEDATPGAFGPEHPIRLPVIAPGRSVVVPRVLTGVQRGRFTLGPATLTVRDPFGMVQRRRRLEHTSVLMVYPRIDPLPPGVPLGGASGSVSTGPRRVTHHGDDLADLREYVRGDDLRAVHWASTAHRGKLMVRRAEETTAPRATVVMDLRRDRHHGTGPQASLEAVVSAVASVVHHLDARQRGVTLLEGPGRELVAPRPAAAWLPTLAAVQATEVDLPALLRQVATSAAGEGTLVAVVTAPDPQELSALVRAGRGAASRLAVLVDAPTFAGRASDPHLPVAVAGLRAAGWRVTSLAAGERLPERWQDLLGRGRQRMADVAGTR